MVEARTHVQSDLSYNGRLYHDGVVVSRNTTYVQPTAHERTLAQTGIIGTSLSAIFRVRSVKES